MDVATSVAGLITSLNEVVEQRLQEMVRSVEEQHFAWLDEILSEAKERFCCGEPELLPRTPSAKNRQKKRISLLIKDPRKSSGHGRRSIARRSLLKMPTLQPLTYLAEYETAVPMVKADPSAIPRGKPLVAMITTTCSDKVELTAPEKEEELVLQCCDGDGNRNPEAQAEVANVEANGKVCRSLVMEFKDSPPISQSTEPLQLKTEVQLEEKPHCIVTRLQKRQQQLLKAKVLRSTHRNTGTPSSKESNATPTKAPLTSAWSSPAVMSTASATTCSSIPMISASARETGNNADAIQVSRPSLKRTLLMGLNASPMRAPPKKKFQAISTNALKRAVTFAEVGPHNLVSQIYKVLSPGRPLLAGRVATPKAIAKPDSLRKAEIKESERQVLNEHLKKKQEMDEERKRKAEETKKQKLEDMKKKREERQQKAREKMEQQELKKKKKAEEKMEKEDEERLRKANEAKKLPKTPVPQPRAVKIIVNATSKNVLDESVKVVDGPQTYEITPQSALLPKLPPMTDENYGIDLESGDSTDDESSPKKAIPLWATDGYLARNLYEQYVTPPNLDSLFGEIEMPDLAVIFCKHKQRYVSRTSSANWNSPPLKNTRLGILGH